MHPPSPPPNFLREALLLFQRAGPDLEPSLRTFFLQLPVAALVPVLRTGLLGGKGGFSASLLALCAFLDEQAGDGVQSHLLTLFDQIQGQNQNQDQDRELSTRLFLLLVVVAAC